MQNERTLREALTQWKCPACGGSKRYRGYSKEAAQGQECRKCKDTDGLHPIAFAALQSVPSSPLCPREDCPVHLVDTRQPTTKEMAYAENLAAAPSDAGQPATDHLNKASEFFDAWIMGHLGRVSLVQALANLTQAMEQRIRNEYAAKLSPPPRTCQEEQD